MSNRWIRFLLAVLAIVAAAAAAYRIVQDERRLAADVAATRAAAFASETALTSVEELKAALHAYVAPGQGYAFWSTRAGLLLDKLRSTLLELDSVATASGAPLAESLDSSDRLAAVEQRAREHVRTAQPLLAGEVIFKDARDLLDGIRIQIARTRDQIATVASRRQTDIRREQTWLAGGAAGILAFVLLLLVPPGRTTPRSDEAPAAQEAAVASASARSESQASSGETSPKRRQNRDGREGGPDAFEASVLREPGAADAGVASLAPDLAALCHNLAAVSDSRQIGDLLDEAGRLLSAKGVIVWLTSPDRNELHAVASSGYDERVMSRIGPIHREDGNLTAAAFRENVARTSAATVSSAAALAVPLPSPVGPAGVFSAELRPDIAVNDASLAAARIIAAQLGSLLGSIPANEVEPQKAQK